MNTSRRVWQILLPVVLLLSVLASCGSKEEVHWQKTATYTAATMSGTTGTEVQSTSSSSSSSALTEVTTAKPNETEPPTEYIYVNGADEIKLEDVAAMFTVDDIDLSAQMGYVTHKSGDIYAGKEEWFEFVRLVEEGTPAVVRVVSFFYADKSGSKDEVYVDDLTFNGLNFIYKHYYSGTESPAIYFRYL
ncbi:MAG: hypothetical protein IKM04_00130 [Clostridia bacterium]|nr:hypothetical protein [Clostridia bacterium]